MNAWIARFDGGFAIKIQSSSAGFAA